MDSPRYVLDNGTKIVTHDHLDSTGGMMINPLHLGARKPGAKGVIRGIVGGHGGDVYWVGHEEGQPLAAYGYTEFELDEVLPEPKTAYDVIGGDE